MQKTYILFNVHKKCTTADAVLSKIIYPEKMNSEQLRKVLAPLKLKQDKAMSRTQNDLLIHYCQWVHVEKRERRVIDDKEYNLNSVNTTDHGDKLISDDAADEFIVTDINAENFTKFAEDVAGG